MSKDFDNEMFYENQELIELVEKLKNNNVNFNVAKDNICTFDAECIEGGVTYKTFLNKFVHMSNNQLKITDIQIDDFDETEMEDFDFDHFGMDEDIDIEEFDFCMEEGAIIGIDFKINGKLTSIEIEFAYDWFNDAFVYKINEKLKELKQDKYLWFSNCAEECNIIYASQENINKINGEMKTNKKFACYTPFVTKGERI